MTVTAGPAAPTCAAASAAPSQTPAVEVAAALILRGERFLACQRPPHKARGGLWEFVGGKLEPGETPAAALVRECREELGVSITVTGEFMRLTHTYPDLTVTLHVLYAALAPGEEPVLLEHTDARWLTPAEAAEYPFCPADAPVLEALAKAFPPSAAE